MKKIKNDKTKKEFHYTNPEMVTDLMKLIPFENGDEVLDTGSGKNKVWFDETRKYGVFGFECEIEDGCNFLEWERKVDWVIGNPPFDIGWKFTEKAVEVANKGIAFLGTIKFLNQFTPKRLEFMKNNKFELQHIHIISDSRWYGRCYFLIFEKKKGVLSWKLETYKN